MNRQEAIDFILSSLKNMHDRDLLDTLNAIDSESGNEILGDDRLWIIERDLPDFCAGMDGIEVYGYFATASDEETSGPFDFSRDYFGGYTFTDGAGSLDGMYSTDRFTYRDFLTDDLAERIIDNYDALEYYLPYEICKAIESIN